MGRPLIVPTFTVCHCPDPEIGADPADNGIEAKPHGYIRITKNGVQQGPSWFVRLHSVEAAFDDLTRFDHRSGTLPERVHRILWMAIQSAIQQARCGRTVTAA